MKYILILITLLLALVSVSGQTNIPKPKPSNLGAVQVDTILCDCINCVPNGTWIPNIAISTVIELCAQPGAIIPTGKTIEVGDVIAINTDELGIIHISFYSNRKYQRTHFKYLVTNQIP